MIWHIFGYWLSFLFPAFYKKIEGKNIHFLKEKGPAIIAMNHPNAFTDPILITHLTYPLRPKYMARGDAFKPGFAAWLLETLGIVPIFRMRDGGKQGLKKNDDSYRRVNALLKKGEKIIVFAEGLCVQERRLRPLKKGVARMVFGAYESLGDSQLKVIPVGLNYSKANEFRSDVFYNIGEPIFIRDYMQEYLQNPARAQTLFLNELSQKMKGLISHIQNPEDDEAVYHVEELLKHQIIVSKNLNPENPEHNLIALQEITEMVNKASVEKPELVTRFKSEAKNYFQLLQTHRIGDRWFDESTNLPHNSFTLARNSIILLMGLPLFVIGLIGNYLALSVIHTLTKKFITSIEFYSSIALALGMLVFAFNYLALYFIVASFSENVFVPYLICLLFFISAWYSLWYHSILQGTLEMRRYLKNPQLVKTIIQQRLELLSLINKF